MKLEYQVCSLELAKQLKELGVKQESLFYWRLGYSTSESFDNGRSLGRQGHFRDYELAYYPKPRLTTADVKWNTADLRKLDELEMAAFTVAELGEMLPQHIDVAGKWFVPLWSRDSTTDDWRMSWSPSNRVRSHALDIKMTEAKTEADARAKMLIYLIENGLVGITIEVNTK